MIWSKFKSSGIGFTLIELIIFIVVGAILLPASFIAFTAAVKHFSRPDHYVKARFFAEQKMEELTSNAYSGINVTPAIVIEGLSEAGFQQRSWNICHVLPSSPDQCVSSDPTNEPNYYYKKIVVSIAMSDGSAYDVSTLVTKRPKTP